MTDSEKYFISTFHPDKRILGKLVVLKRRLDILAKAGFEVAIDYDHIRDIMWDYLYKELSNGSKVFHYDKGPYIEGSKQPKKINKNHYAILNHAFKSTSSLISKYKLGINLADIYKNQIKVKKTLGDLDDLDALRELKEQIENGKNN